MKYDLVIKIQTDADLTSWSLGKDILSRVFSEPLLAPQRVATFSEVTSINGSEIQNLESCNSYWGTKVEMRMGGVSREITADFHWRRLNVAKSQGVVTFSNINQKKMKSPASIFFQSQYRKQLNWVDIFKSWCVATNSFAAILHPFILMDGPVKNNRDVRTYSSEEDIQQHAWARFLGGTLYSEFRAGDLNSLVSGLTNLGWASWFGEDLSKEVNMDKLTQEGFPVSKIGNGYLVQVTENINEALDNFSLFSKRRAKLKSLFRDDLFIIKDEPERG